MSNEEVARFLLQHGLEGLDAVVFLDAQDVKMVVDRRFVLLLLLLLFL
jgi:hypothetical protein